MDRSKISVFFFSFVLFTAATLFGVHFGIDVARLNLILATGFMLYLFYDKKTFGVLILLGLIGIVLSFYALPSHIGWIIFSVYLLSIWGVSENKSALNAGRLLIFAGAFCNLSFITNTRFSDVQYDFLSCYNYIEYIYENNFLFWQENPLLTRPSYSSYHPILHFFIAAVFHRLFLILTQDITAVNEALQVVFSFYMLWYYFIAARILRLFKLSAGAYLTAVSFVVFFPLYNAMSGFFNNDCLLLPLQAGTVYYSLLYYQNEEKKNLWFVLLFAMLCSLTKLSGILVLPLLGGIFILKLWQKKDIKTFREISLFSIALAAGLLIWPLYQHFHLHLGAFFVPPQEHLSLLGYSFIERFNPIRGFFYERMFYNDFGINLWETMTKTALFGQWDFSFRVEKIFWLLGYFVFLYKLILFFCFSGIIYLLCLKGKKTDLILVLLLLISLLFGQVVFGIMHPSMCNQDFRYIAILVLPNAVVMSFFIEKAPLVLKRILIGSVVIFSFLSVFIWQWTATFGG